MIKKVLAVVVGGALLVVVLVVAFVSMGPPDLHQCYVVAHAQVDPSIPATPSDELLGGHRIAAGEGTIIAIREFTNGNWTLTDNQSFRKLTIELPGALALGHRDLAAPGTLVRYSIGSSSFASRGHGYVGASATGRMTLTRRDSAIEVRIVGTVPVRGLVFPTDGSVTEPLDEAYRCREIAPSEVSPWIGKRDGSVSAEAQAWNDWRGLAAARFAGDDRIATGSGPH